MIPELRVELQVLVAQVFQEGEHAERFRRPLEHLQVGRQTDLEKKTFIDVMAVAQVVERWHYVRAGCV